MHNKILKYIYLKLFNSYSRYIDLIDSYWIQSLVLLCIKNDNKKKISFSSAAGGELIGWFQGRHRVSGEGVNKGLVLFIPRYGSLDWCRLSAYPQAYSLACLCLNALSANGIIIFLPSISTVISVWQKLDLMTCWYGIHQCDPLILVL